MNLNIRRIEMLDKLVDRLIQNMEEYPEDWTLSTHLFARQDLAVWIAGGKGGYSLDNPRSGKFSRKSQRKFDVALSRFFYKRCVDILKTRPKKGKKA